MTTETEKKPGDTDEQVPAGDGTEKKNGDDGAQTDAPGSERP